MGSCLDLMRTCFCIPDLDGSVSEWRHNALLVGTEHGADHVIVELGSERVRVARLRLIHLPIVARELLRAVQLEVAASVLSGNRYAGKIPICCVEERLTVTRSSHNNGRPSCTREQIKEDFPIPLSALKRIASPSTTTAPAWKGTRP